MLSWFGNSEKLSTRGCYIKKKYTKYHVLSHEMVDELKGYVRAWVYLIGNDDLSATLSCPEQKLAVEPAERQ